MLHYIFVFIYIECFTNRLQNSGILKKKFAYWVLKYIIKYTLFTGYEVNISLKNKLIV